MSLVAKISEATAGMVGFNDWLAARAIDPTPWKRD